MILLGLSADGPRPHGGGGGGGGGGGPLLIFKKDISKIGHIIFQTLYFIGVWHV